MSVFSRSEMESWTRLSAGDAVPIRVAAELGSPLAFDAPCLDAVMEMACVESAAIAGFDVQSQLNRHEPAPAPGLIPIPLVRTNVEGWPVARASAAIVPEPAPMGEATIRIARAFKAMDGEAMNPSKRGTIHTGSGSLKSYWEPVRVRAVRAIAWFGLGDPDAVRRVLTMVDWIGPKRRQGYGQIVSWIVDPVTDGVDRSWTAPMDGGRTRLLMRPLPLGVRSTELGSHDAQGLDSLSGWRRGYAAVCGPYWHPDRQIEALVVCDDSEVGQC